MPKIDWGESHWFAQVFSAVAFVVSFPLAIQMTCRLRWPMYGVSIPGTLVAPWWAGIVLFAAISIAVAIIFFYQRCIWPPALALVGSGITLMIAPPWMMLNLEAVLSLALAGIIITAIGIGWGAALILACHLSKTCSP